MIGAAKQAIHAASLNRPDRISRLRDPGAERVVVELGTLSPSVRCRKSSIEEEDVTDRQQRWSQLETRDDVMPRAKCADPAASDPSRSLEAFHEQYAMGPVLGRGGFAAVHEARHRTTGAKLAVKRLQSGAMSSEAMRVEVSVLQALDHPNIVKMVSAFWSADGSEMWLLEELATGGELFRWIEARGRPLHAAEQAALSRQLLRGVACLHDNGVVHRDLKPGNLLLSDATDGARLLITDFGLCAHLKARSPEPRRGGDDESDGEGGVTSTGITPRRRQRRGSLRSDATRRTMCGTPEWMAPEMVLCAESGAAGYSFPCDLWSAGCVIFSILTGQTRGPFHCEGEGGERDLSALFEAILTAKLPLDRIGDYWARDLVSNLLSIRPEQRSTAADALTHPWLAADEEAASPGATADARGARDAGAEGGAAAGAEPKEREPAVLADRAPAFERRAKRGWVRPTTPRRGSPLKMQAPPRSPALWEAATVALRKEVDAATAKASDANAAAAHPAPSPQSWRSPIGALTPAAEAAVAGCGAEAVALASARPCPTPTPRLVAGGADAAPQTVRPRQGQARATGEASSSDDETGVLPPVRVPATARLRPASTAALDSSRLARVARGPGVPAQRGQPVPFAGRIRGIVSAPDASEDSPRPYAFGGMQGLPARRRPRGGVAAPTPQAVAAPAPVPPRRPSRRARSIATAGGLCGAGLDGGDRPAPRATTTGPVLTTRAAGRAEARGIGAL